MKHTIYSKGIITLCLVLLQGCGSSNDNSPSGTTLPLTPQNEPYYLYLWHLNANNSTLNSRGYPVDSNADIHIEQAWSITKGAGIKVAVIDDGFDVRHEDLQANTIATYNADTGTQNVQYYGFDGAHGSTCAGFIAAPVNRVGIVGVAPESKLILIKQESYSDANLIKAFEYAKNQGAKVINCSWGTGQVSEAIEEEFKALYDTGITIVFASGNDGEDLDTNGSHDESESVWVIGVGASGENNDVTGYSNYGYAIDILAPGGNRNYSIGVLGIDDMGIRGSNNQESLVDHNYAFNYGTSFAAPIVAGAASLIYSINPYLTPKQIRDILVQSADKIGEGATYDHNGFDVYKRRAYGKVNVSRAVDRASGL